MKWDGWTNFFCEVVMFCSSGNNEEMGKREARVINMEWSTVAQSLEDHLARREAPEGPPDVEEADDADHLEVLGVELRQHVAAELEEDRGEEEPVGGAEDEGRAAEAAPVADEVDAELEEEEGAKNGVDSAEELENRRIGHLQELRLKYA